MNVKYNLVPSRVGVKNYLVNSEIYTANQRNATLDSQVVEQYLVYMSIFWCVGSRDSGSIFTPPQRLHDPVEKKMLDQGHSDWNPLGFALCETCHCAIYRVILRCGSVPRVH